MQQLIELVGRHALDSFFLGDQPFPDHIHGNAHSGRTGSLAVARLEHVELAFLDGELKILHVAIVLLEARGDLNQLFVCFRQNLFELGDRQRRANSRNHVFALRIHQKLAVERLSRRWKDCA